MRIGISALNVRTERDYWRLNKLVQNLGGSPTGEAFLLLARKAQEDLIEPAPGNFEYRFIDLPSARKQSDLPLLEKLFGESLSDFRCELLFEFGSSGLTGLGLPRVSLVTDDFIDPRRKKGRASGRRNRLKLVARAASQNPARSEEILFPSRFTPDRPAEIISGLDTEDQTGEKGRLFSRYGLTDKYLSCFVCADYLKELRCLFKAYRHACALNPSMPDLVLAGADQFSTEIARITDASAKAGLESKIRYLGMLSEHEIPGFLQESLALIYPHDYGDSPDILLTAMACGCAMLCSNRQDIPEITGDSALYFDPRDWRDLGFKLALISRDNDLADFLKRCANTNAPRFSWENTTGRLMGFFTDLLKDRDLISSPAVREEVTQSER
jgi:glycosyltransferase involved in cell wall biosynthesis